MNADRIFESLVRFLESTSIQTVAMSQGGDHFSGSAGTSFRLRRKAMNTFICDAERPIRFVGRINEDVNTYVGRGRMGELFFTYMAYQITQKATQTNQGGMTELYLDSGTYVKSFYSVMGAPSCVHIRTMGAKHKRLHHKINWRLTAPKILDEKYAKPRG